MSSWVSGKATTNAASNIRVHFFCTRQLCYAPLHPGEGRQPRQFVRCCNYHGYGSNLRAFHTQQYSIHFHTIIRALILYLHQAHIRACTNVQSLQTGPYRLESILCPRQLVHKFTQFSSFEIQKDNTHTHPTTTRGERSAPNTTAYPNRRQRASSHTRARWDPSI